MKASGDAIVAGKAPHGSNFVAPGIQSLAELHQVSDRGSRTVPDGGAMIVDARWLESEIAAGLALVREKCPPATLKLVQEGVGASPFTRPKLLRFCGRLSTQGSTED